MASSFEKFKDGLYNYYVSDCNKKSVIPMSFDKFFDCVQEYKSRTDKYLVYIGKNKKGDIVYVGTTIQYPISRWYHHKIHGKPNIKFEEYIRFDNEKDMLNKEYELIQKFHPQLNKIVSRPQNYNVPLTDEELKNRVGDPEWCQCCLKRRVNKGYKFCYACSR